MSSVGGTMRAASSLGWLWRRSGASVRWCSRRTPIAHDRNTIADLRVEVHDAACRRVRLRSRLLLLDTFAAQEIQSLRVCRWLENCPVSSCVVERARCAAIGLFGPLDLRERRPDRDRNRVTEGRAYRQARCRVQRAHEGVDWTRNLRVSSELACMTSARCSSLETSAVPLETQLLAWPREYADDSTRTELLASSLELGMLLALEFCVSRDVAMQSTK